MSYELEAASDEEARDGFFFNSPYPSLMAREGIEMDEKRLEKQKKLV
ncbi:MAG TPA: hypothetical protein PKL83_03235 [bacterium]|nr:hypothetical protein [bacterium]